MDRDPLELVQTLTTGFVTVDFDLFRDALQESRNMEEFAERAGDFGAFVRDTLDPEVELGLHGIRGASVLGARFSGSQGWLDFWRAWLEPWSSYRIEFSNWAQRGDAVLVTLDIDAEGRGSGVEVHDTIDQVWTVRDGLVAGLDMYANRDRSLAALQGDLG